MKQKTPKEYADSTKPLIRPQIYLAARYSRREELCQYRSALEDDGHFVQARWLNGGHQIDESGKPIGESGEQLVESGSDDGASLRARFAQDDWEDVSSAEVVVNFTEGPRSKANRGGRHVEFGIALARGARVIVVGHRENIFHWLPQVEFVETFEQARSLLRPNSQSSATAKVTKEQTNED